MILLEEKLATTLNLSLFLLIPVKMFWFFVMQRKLLVETLTLNCNTLGALRGTSC